MINVERRRDMGTGVYIGLLCTPLYPYIQKKKGKGEWKKNNRKLKKKNRKKREC